MSTAKEPLITAGSMHSDNNTFLRLQRSSSSSRQCPPPEHVWIFDELPKATIVSVSRTDTTGDLSPMLLSYTIELQYKQFKWRLVKKASQVLYLHFALKKRALIKELYEKQEQVKEWLHSLGIVDQIAVVQDADEPDDGAVPIQQHEDSARNRNVPSRAALSFLRPALGGQQCISDRAKVAMQNYLNHFLGNLGIVNSREVCKFLEVSKLSFSREYGPKLKEGYIMAKDLPKFCNAECNISCWPCDWFNFWNNNWQKVWAVLKPGFLALLEDPFDTKIVDILVFDVLPSSNGKGERKAYLADQIKERNPLYYVFKVSSGNRSINLRSTSGGKVKEWIAAIREAGLKPLEGWCHPHRYGSFAPPRGLTEDGSQAQWFVDGDAAFGAIASALENAKSEIFITGWWLCPELYLKRPFQCHASSRLDSLLEAKAKEGVQIYILLYKEVSIALKINSMYSKKRLLNIHENLRVLRYPDHFPTGVYLWSHHEKLVIVDYQICFIGGLDLCFGRYDTVEHRVGDFPSDLWPGKDYYNPRESEPNSWEDMMTDELNRRKYPRMPWHDVHCALWGPPCQDIARHFVQRWNHAKRSKAPNEQTIPLLMPHHHMVLPHYMGRSKDVDVEKNAGRNKKNLSRTNSFASLSPLQNIPLLLPREAQAPVANSADHNSTPKSKNDNLLDQQSGLCGSFSLSLQTPNTETSVPNTPVKSLVNEHDSEDAESKMQMSDESSEDQDVSFTEYGQVGPQSACRCQVIRSVSQWSIGASQPEDSVHKAHISLIEKAEHFIYIENQFFISGLWGDEIIQNRVLDALYRRILQAHKEQKSFRVIVVIPLLPGFQGGMDDGGAATVRALTHWQYRTISWEKTSILYNLTTLLGPQAHNYISFYGLRSYGRLFEGGPLATSQVYVHSKLMIVDDRVAFIGSSNINDRSLLGSRDSEIGVVIEDKEFVESSMNGETWKAGNFAYGLRCSLWSEHLGLSAGEMDKISDPIAETTYRDLWLATAKENTKIYQDVFACLPNDEICSRAALRQSMHHWKEKLGHTTIDLGIAPEKIEWIDYEGQTKMMDPIERLKLIRGHLVCFPLNFMHQEDLRPMFNEGEFYASPQVYH